MAQFQLTQGGIHKMLSDEHVPLRLQVVACKTIEAKHQASGQAPQPGPRVKALLSDGDNSLSVILASQLVHLVKNQDIKEGTVVDVPEFVKNTVNDKSVVIVLNVVIVGHCPKIGNPVIAGSANNGGPQPVAAAGGGGPNVATAPGPYGAPPTVQNGGPYGAPPPANNPYGGPPAGPGAGPYGAPPPQHQQQQPYNNGNGYGAPPQHQQQQYGNNNQGGHPPVAGNGYGAPPPAAVAPGGGYGAPPQKQHQPYGAPPNGAGAGVNAGGAPQPQYRPAPGGVTARNEAPPNLMPIMALNSYQNRWTIKARVTQKSDRRRYSSQRGEGQFFSFDLLDAEGGEIRVVGWNDQCDRFFDQVHVGRVYTLTRASLRSKRGNFNQTRHPLEIHLETSSVLSEIPEDDGAIPTINFNFVPLSQIEDTPPGVMVDICTVVESIAETTEITKRDGTQVQKRAVNLRDASGRSIELTFWDKFVENPGNQIAEAIRNGHTPILAIKSARVGDFNGKTLSTGSASTVLIDPTDVPEVTQLRHWFVTGGAAQPPQALSTRGGGGGGRSDRRVTVGQIKGEGLGMSLDGKPDYVSTTATLLYAKSEGYCYPACTNNYNGRPCNKKMIDQSGDGTAWHCERCQLSGMPEYRYILNVQIGDHTDAQWATAFNESGQEIVGISANDLKGWEDSMLEDGSKNPRHDITWKDVLFKTMKLKLKINEDNYNEEKRLRINIVKAEEANYTEEAKATLEAIARVERNEQAFPANAALAGGAGGNYGGGAMPPVAAGGAPPHVGGGYGGPPVAAMPMQGMHQQQPQHYQQQQPWGAPPQQQGGYGGGAGGYAAPPPANGGYNAPPGGGYGGTW